MSFIDLVLESTKEYEAPRRFYYWAALSSISAVLKDQVWFDMAKAYKLYPNLYVLLYGPSGVRKGPPISLAERIVKAVNATRVINGRSSIEAVLKELGTFSTEPGRGLVKDSCGFLVASELSSSIISNPQAMDIMTNLYDRIYNESEWKYKLKVGESSTLNKPTITWLAGTNEALFKDFLPEKNIHGGLIGRMFMVSEFKPARLNSLMFDPDVIPDFPKMVDLLRPVSKLKGQFEMDKEVRVNIDMWYQDFMGNIAPQIADQTGFVSRINDFIIKGAMIIAAGRRCEMKIYQSDIDESREVIVPLIVPTKKISHGLKKEPVNPVQQRALVLNYISNRPNFTCTRKEILKNLGLKVNHEELDAVIEMMLQMGAVKIESQGSEVHYSLNMQNKTIAEWVQQYRS